jgi:hypothetical protein
MLVHEPFNLAISMLSKPASVICPFAMSASILFLLILDHTLFAFLLVKPITAQAGN